MKSISLLFSAALLTSCSEVTREEAIAMAHRYTQVSWMPEERHVRHGPDSRGIAVKTPDRTLKEQGGWWKPGAAATGMPYQWGGFDTPESFLKKIAAGNKAGDIATERKRQLGDAGTSAESCGVDCSGYVSRCWKLSRSHSTAELPQICDPLASWADLRPGDILLNHRHVMLFAKWNDSGKELDAYEAGRYPAWRVRRAALNADMLRAQGYRPWRYRKIMEDPQLQPASINRLAREWR